MKIMFLRNRNALNLRWLVQFVNLLNTSEHSCVIACNTYKAIEEGSEPFCEVRLINPNYTKKNPLLSKTCSKTKYKFFPQKEVLCIPKWGEVVQKNNRDNLEIEKKRITYTARVEKEGKRPHLLVRPFAKQYQISNQIFINGGV